MPKIIHAHTGDAFLTVQKRIGVYVPPIRKYIVETEAIVTVAWIVLTFVLLSKVRNEVRYKIIMQ